MRVVHGHGIHSTVYRDRSQNLEKGEHSSDESYDWVAIKSVGDHSSWKFRPHNVRKEIKILQAMNHPNVIRLLQVLRNSDELSFELYMPLIPLSLDTILDSPKFVPDGIEPPFMGPMTLPLIKGSFEPLSKSIIFQVFSALHYLHTGGQSEKQPQLWQPIAHRDIKPSNILINPDGLVKLVDFGVAWAPDFVESADEADDVWIEPQNQMCCQVASGPYRAPELLFSPRVYDSCATDIWSLGVVITQLFRPLRWEQEQSYDDESDDDDDDDEEDSKEDITQSFILPKSKKLKLDEEDGKWVRTTLFDASRGEIGLIWSIFKVRGTPDETTWPTFKSLPDAKSASFRQTPRVDLSKTLPNLPKPNTGDYAKQVLDLVERLLEYEPSKRISASVALKHDWFLNGVALPKGYRSDLMPQGTDVSSWNLADILGPLAQKEYQRYEEEEAKPRTVYGLSWDDE